jgi:O-antigen/teichoic acid export membrane protein
MAWQRIWREERLWLILSMMSARAVGFLTSVMISRWAGPSALGIYAAVVNVSGSTVAQVALVMQNNAALMSGSSGGPGRAQALVRAHVLPLLVIMALALALFGVLSRESGLTGLDVLTGVLVWAGAAAVIFAQMGGGIAAGLNQGIGQFLLPARLAVLTSAVMVGAAVVCIWTWGLQGGLGCLIVSSTVGPLIGLVIFLRKGALAHRRQNDVDAELGAAVVTSTVWRALWRSAPAVGTAILTAACTWLCAVYLVNRAHGVAGIGVASVGIQWATIMLVPVSSWAGVTFKQVMDAHASTDTPMRQVHVSLIRRNLAVTGVMAACVACAGGWIASLYKLPADVLWPLLGAICMYAVLVSINGVTERVMFVRGQQLPWLWFTLFGCAMQVIVCLFVLPKGLFGYGLGLATAELSILVLSWSYTYGRRSCSRS